MPGAYRVLLISIQLLLFASCALFQSEIDTVIDLLPRDTDMSGWRRTALPVEYKSSSVKRHNSDYENSGIEKMSFCDFVSDNDAAVRVEILRFDSVLNAYGFFTTKRGEGRFNIGTVNEFYGNAYAIAQRGEYIIYTYKLRGSEPIENVFADLLKISIRNISDNYSRESLPGTAGILSLDRNSGVIYSIKMIENPDMIDKIYYTNWIYNNSTIRIFISERISFNDSYGILKIKIKKGYVLTEVGQEHTAFQKTDDGKYNFISIKNNWIYGCCYVPDISTGKKIVDALRLRITPYLR